jgi:D-3-phosphoglycerate dehydrogenase
MRKIKIIVADEADQNSFNILPPEEFLIRYQPKISNKKLIEKFSDYEVLVIRSTRKISSEYLSRTNHKLIATLSKGTEHIDEKAAGEKGIGIINSKSGNYISAAEHTLGLIIASSRNICYSDRLTRAGKFLNYDFRRNELKGKKIGIIGYGKVGSYLGNLCKSLGMKIYANDIDRKVIQKNPGIKFYPLQNILKNCDIVSIHIPSSKNNFHFFNKENLNLINKDAILINTSRGNVIDEETLIKFLRKGKIRFAALDVFENEPGINPELIKLKNVILTNHAAGKTSESRERISKDIFLKIKRLFKK